MNMVSLGNTGLLVSRVGFGVLPMGPAQAALPVEEGAALLCYAMTHGINFFDTAQYYRTYPYLRKALQHATSIQPVLCSKSLATDYAGMTAAIEEARIALNRDVIDIFLLHEVRSGQLAARRGAWQALIRARARGQVRAIGLSTHHVDVTAQAAAIDELDVVFPLLNYAGLGLRLGNQFATVAEMESAIATCKQAGKGIFTMKALGGGVLMPHYQEALHYAFTQPAVDAVMLGFSRRQEIDDLLHYLDGTMAETYNPDLSHKRFHISQEDCEGCGACRNACPAGAIDWNEKGLAQIDQTRCLTCGYCAPVCPVRAVIRY